jgi:UDPglucose 6-dehydrogenase
MDNARSALTDKVVFADNAKTCLQGADVVVITTPWPEFQQLSPQDLKKSNGRTTIFDCWRLLSQDKFAAVADYRSIGLGPKTNHEQSMPSDQPAVIAKGA